MEKTITNEKLKNKENTEAVLSWQFLKRENLFSPKESRWVHIRAGSMPSSRWPTQRTPWGFSGVPCLTELCQGLFSPHGSFAYMLWFLILFLRVFLCVQMCVSQNLYVVFCCFFCSSPPPHLFCPILACLYLVTSYFTIVILIISDTCLHSNEREGKLGWCPDEWRRGKDLGDAGERDPQLEYII